MPSTDILADLALKPLPSALQAKLSLDQTYLRKDKTEVKEGREGARHMANEPVVLPSPVPSKLVANSQALFIIAPLN